MATIGQKLGEARKEAGLSVADVSHETHIHANMIYSIEEDDFSKFASVAYAKSFIRNYAEFLGVDLGSAMEALDASKTLRLGEHELMGEMKKTIKKDRRFRLQRNPSLRRRIIKPGGAPVFLNIILGTLIAAIVVFYFLGYQATSPEEARDEITKGLQKANPFGEGKGAVAGVDAGADAAGAELPGDSSAAVPEDAPEPALPTLKRVELALETGPGSPPGAPFGPSPGGSPAAATPGAPSSSGDGPAANPPAPPAAGPGSNAEGDIVKPEVNWSVEESRPSPLARVGEVKPETLKSTETPGLEIETEEIPVTPIQSAELPMIQRVLEEPNAALRPAGTDPVPEQEAGAEEAGTGGTGESSGTSDRSPPRAVPVAVAE